MNRFLLSASVLLTSLPSLAVDLPVATTFEGGLEGWSLEGSGTLAWTAEGGHPAGCARFSDTTSTGGDGFLVAPSKYLGDWSVLDGCGYLLWDHVVFQPGGGASYVTASAMLQGAGGSATWTSLLPCTTEWRTFAVPVNVAAWNVTGSWSSLLANVTQLRIRIEGVHNSGSPLDIDGIDNVRLVKVDWRERGPDVRPAGRYRGAMVYDVAAQTNILFGGWAATTEGYLNDTWEWDGNNWSQRSGDSPPGRCAHALAYDSFHNRTVLYGGIRKVGGTWQNLGDTWEWDGSTWGLVANSGPAARQGPAMVYDTSRNRTVLFGGFPGNGGDDTWEWDGGAWLLRTSNGPPSRLDHAMAFDSDRNRIVLFGGQSGPAFLGDTWEWNGSVWTERTVVGPAPRHCHGMIYDKERHCIILFGGFLADGSRSGETWQWDGRRWTQIMTDSNPPALGCPATSYDAGRGVSVVFGGSDGAGFANRTWELWDASTANPLPSDFDRDGDVDEDDFQVFLACASGPAVPAFPACLECDLDSDSDIDMADFARLQRCYSGPGQPVNRFCTD